MVLGFSCWCLSSALFCEMSRVRNEWMCANGVVGCYSSSFTLIDCLRHSYLTESAHTHGITTVSISTLMRFKYHCLVVEYSSKGYATMVRTRQSSSTAGSSLGDTGSARSSERICPTRRGYLQIRTARGIALESKVEWVKPSNFHVEFPSKFMASNGSFTTGHLLMIASSLDLATKATPRGNMETRHPA